MVMDIRTTAGKFNRQPDNKPACTKCGHCSVCAIYRAIKPLMGNWPEEQQPFKAEDISKICGLYAEGFIVIPKAEPEPNQGR